MNPQEMMMSMMSSLPDRQKTIDLLKAPFSRRDLRFKEGVSGKKWFPYFDVDCLTDRLNDATGNCWDLSMEKMERYDTLLICYGHLSITGLGRRAGVGIQEHTSPGGKAMGADMLKGVRADLLKNCGILFGLGAQVRTMDALSFDPEDDRNAGRLQPYLDFYFPNDAPAAESPLQWARDKSASAPTGFLPQGHGRRGFATEAGKGGPFPDLADDALSPFIPEQWDEINRRRANRGECPLTAPASGLTCTDCPATINAAQKALSLRAFGAQLCPACQKARKVAA